MSKTKYYKSDVVRRFVTIRMSESEWSAIQKHLRAKGYSQTSFFTMLVREYFTKSNVLK